MALLNPPDPVEAVLFVTVELLSVSDAVPTTLMPPPSPVVAVFPEIVELTTSGDNPQIVDTIPGWAHDITNVGNDEMIVMLWANENFDRDRPDTVSQKV